MKQTLYAGLALSVLLAIPAVAAPDTAKYDPLHAWAGGSDPAQLEAWVGKHIAAAQKHIDRIVTVKGAHTVANTLRPYDEAWNELAIAGNEAYMMYAVGGNAALRDKAQALNEKISGIGAELALNHDVYAALADVHAEHADAATRHYLERTLLEYRLGGVDKDADTRAKIKALQDRITSLSLQFGRNVQEDVRKVSVKKEQLDGLPEDYIARHKPDADGNYEITTDQPDLGPMMSFGRDAGVRRQLWLAYNDRAHPANSKVLLDLLQARQDLATILGYPSYADLATADQMIGSAANARAMLDEVGAASRDASQREFKMVLDFAKSKEPGLSDITDADSRYWMEQYRRANYNFDAQSVRPYFPYDAVQKGILDTAAHLFKVEFKPVHDANVWDASVDVFDVYDGGKRAGRIYLDMHPRAGKDKWFSAQPVTPGIRGRQVPEGMLICNFSGGVKGDPGLMQYSEVVTFFHEFGHLMHHLLGSQNQWAGQGGFAVEGDFVEAPSQMLEEFFNDPKLLASFAKNVQTGQPIPAELVGRMTAAAAFGRGSWVQAQLFYSTYSLELHDRDPRKIDLDAMLQQNAKRFLPATFVDGDHMYDSFTHLTGYASNYYTYVLDKVIAIDFFGQFDKANLLDGPTAMRYRQKVLEPGATKPAAELVKDFLGRPQGIAPLKAWIGQEFEPAPK
ncbi:MAG: Zn-dependent oligopeptidase [Burkholderiaceae bacterium]|nr:Zn-dependent oligopeptidase [Burkholderiaceae bacterium]